MVRILIGVIAAANVLFGLGALFLPDRVGGLVGFGLEDAAATGELRAVYGGLVLALGVVMALALRVAEGRHWLRALGLCFLGLVLGRAVSLLLDGPTAWNAVALLFEGATAGLLLHAARRPAGAEPAD